LYAPARKPPYHIWTACAAIYDAKKNIIDVLLIIILGLRECGRILSNLIAVDFFFPRSFA
jgi:hypothetical protein